MSSTLLEVTRSAHEEVERLERLAVKDLQREPGSNRERLHQNHRVRNMVDSIISTTDKLVRFPINLDPKTLKILAFCSCRFIYVHLLLFFLFAD